MFKSLSIYRISESLAIYKLIDSDFQMDLKVSSKLLTLDIEKELARIYEAKNLNVAANILLYYQYSCQYSGWAISKLINHNLTYYSIVAKTFYDKYPDIKKYMSLL